MASPENEKSISADFDNLSQAGLSKRAGSEPFRSPARFDKFGEAGLVGGGSTPSPGEISLAHNGVLLC